MRRFRLVPISAAVLLWLTTVVLGLQLSPAPMPQPAAPDLTATLEIRRVPGDARNVAIAVTNHGTEPVTVEQAELVTDSLTTTGPITVDVTIPAGAIRDVFIEYGSGICEGELAPESAPAHARLLVATGHRVDVALPHPNGMLDRLLRDDCTRKFLADTATVTFTNWRTADDGRLLADLAVTRLGGHDPIQITGMAGNPHYVIAPAEPAEPIPVLPAGESELTVPVVVDVNRCDQHALAEAKKPFYFPVWLTVGENQRIPATVTVSEADIDEIEIMQARRCG